jgi:hypothetical protein
MRSTPLIRSHLIVAIALLSVSTTPLLAIPVNPNLIAQRRPLYTTADDPVVHITSPGGAFDGVTSLSLNRTDGTFLCSGTLLSNGREILTAAHCLTDDSGNPVTNNVTASFQLSSGNHVLNASTITVHPSWNGDFSIGYDLALITLDNFAPAEIPRHDIYRASDEVGQVVTKAGYGRSGNGDDGDILTAGIKRSGSNIYDALGDVFDAVPGTDPLPGAQLAYDFDDGTSTHDAFGFFDASLATSGLDDLGLGNDEVMSAPGDSGGPTLINNLIAGITSYGLRLDLRGGRPPRTSDVDNQLNSSFGEFAVDTRVSYFASWIDANLTPPPPPPPLLAGDLNGDGFVGIDDINIVLSNWNLPVTPDDLLSGDPSGDGFVGIEDLNTVLSNWNSGAPPATGAAIPEPASSAILCLISCVFACGRNRR